MNETTLTRTDQRTAHRARPSPTAGNALLTGAARVGQRAAEDVPAARWFARCCLHLLLASVPVLAISADVFGWVTLRAVAIWVLLPLAVTTGLLIVREPDRSDRVILAGFVWGLIACAGYDAFRLPTIYLAHLWNDFFGTVGGWATGTTSNFLTGYLWRYAGDGAGIGVAFFALAATLRASSWPYRKVVGAAVIYAVVPVWAGLIVTDLMAPAGRQLFPLTVTTLALSLVGHLIYGAILGHGYWLSRRHEQHWPLTVSALRHLAARRPRAFLPPRPAVAR